MRTAKRPTGTLEASPSETPAAEARGARNRARYPIQAVEKALTIIQLLADNPSQRSMGVTEIARRIGVTKSTTHRLLATLAEGNFVTKDDSDNKYYLGWAFYHAAQRLPQANGVQQIAKPLMQEACAVLGETVNLAVRQGSHMIIIESEGARSGLRVETPRGVPQPLHNSALGKALLLDLDKTAVRQLLGAGPYEATTERTLNTAESLNADLDVSRERGYALDDEEAIPGVRCVGVPVRDYRHEIIAAVSVTGPCQRLAGATLEETAQHARRLGLEISRRVGFTGEATV